MNEIQSNIPTLNTNAQYKYVLKIVQNPLRARMCGFGDKDRRPCSPPPIVQLLVYDQFGNLVDPNNLNSIFYLVTVRLFNSSGTEESCFVYDIGAPPSNQSVLLRNLVGTYTSSANKLRDLENQLGIFFLFPDLSVRNEGIYTLKFTFTNLELHFKNGMQPSQNSVSPPLCEVLSEPFQVFSAKKFEGMVETSALSKCFARQGIKLPIRKDMS